MRVLLITPPHQFHNTYNEHMSKRSWLDRGFGLVPGVTPPLGILYIAAVLREEGHTVFVKDGAFESLRGIRNAIRVHAPELVGISVTGFSWELCKKIIGTLKAEFPNVYFLTGGSLPDAYKERCLVECSGLDFVAFGDGEYIIRDLCNALDKKGDLYHVRGLAFRFNGKIVRNQEMPLLEDLDALPWPARDLVDLKRYCPAIGNYLKLPNTTITGSRGCPYRCIFCHITILPSSARYRNPVKVADEMEFLIDKYKIKDFLFWDNGITDNKKWILELCSEIRQRKLDAVWSGNSRVGAVNFEILREMKKAGCWRLLYGIESGVQKNMDILRKGQTIQQVREGVAATHKADIASFGSFIFGIPGETFKEGLQTIDFAIKLDLDFAKFNTMGIHPGTLLERNFEEHGVITSFIAAQTQELGGFIPYTMNERELEKLIPIAHKKFYLRGKYILKRLMKTQNIDSLHQNVRGGLAFIQS
ncbi:cobalamin B12-binding domain-containing protein [Candidatus Woesearchaeota archaeon]|nr:cobalamin B12-binding domain-containing protein [Candidatus Woesearchaeota archaeon]